jgi:hypothetical protein
LLFFVTFFFIFFSLLLFFVALFFFLLSFLLFLCFTILGAVLKGSSFGAWLRLSVGTELGDRLGFIDLRISLVGELDTSPVSEIGSELGIALGIMLGRRLGF